MPADTEGNRDKLKFIRSITSSYIKDFTKLKATEEKPFRFITATIIEADEHSWYKDLVGKEQLVYMHGYEHEDGTFEVDHYCIYKQIAKDRIEIIGKVKKEHLDI